MGSSKMNQKCNKGAFYIEKKNIDFVKLERKVHLPYIPPRILRNYTTGKPVPKPDMLFPMADSKFRSETSYKCELFDHQQRFYKPRYGSQRPIWADRIATFGQLRINEYFNRLPKIQKQISPCDYHKPIRHSMPRK